jgi:hypothetical protein
VDISFQIYIKELGTDFKLVMINYMNQTTIGCIQIFRISLTFLHQSD